MGQAWCLYTSRNLTLKRQSATLTITPVAVNFWLTAKRRALWRLHTL
jgi:hypothetical protein